MRGKPVRTATLTLVLAASSATLIACAPSRGGSGRDAYPHSPEGPKQAEGQTMDEIFSGKFPGVRVFRAPGGGISLRIRNAGTMANDGEPLFVVDGIRIMSGNGGLLFINPADIETIEVLKDMASLSFYGIQGANGVVLITTKRGP